MEVIDTLEEEVEKLRLDRDSLKQQHGQIDRERDKVRDHVTRSNSSTDSSIASAIR